MSPHRLTIIRRPPSIILPIEAFATGQADHTADVRAHLTPPCAPRRRWPLWACGVAVLLHLLVVAGALLIRFSPSPVLSQSPPGIDIEFEGSGTAAKTTAPPQAIHGPPQQAQTIAPAPAPPPPPPPPAAQAAMQDEVRMPDLPLTALPAPQPISKPKAQTHEPRRHTARPSDAHTQKYVFLNGMSYGNGSSAAAPAPMAPHGMNLSPPMSDAQAATASDFSVKGDAGAGWDAALTKWVQEHAYYPQAAIEQNQQGTATVEFTVDRNGHVSGIRLLSSSGSPFLDQAWFQLFADNNLPRFPAGAKSDHVVVRYTVHYQLIR